MWDLVIVQSTVLQVALRHSSAIICPRNGKWPLEQLGTCKSAPHSVEDSENCFHFSFLCMQIYICTSLFWGCEKSATEESLGPKSIRLESNGNQFLNNFYMVIDFDF